MSVFRRVGKVVLLFLIPVLILFIVNSTVNRHGHLVRGYIYTHAHPYQDDGLGTPFQNHSHSQLAMVLLDLLSNLEIILSVVILSLVVFSQPAMLILPVKERLSSIFGLLNLSPRAPPGFV